MSRLERARRSLPRHAMVAAALAASGLLAAAQSGKPSLAPEPLDLNTASAAELEKLPGVGPVTAQAILDFREKSGPFRRVEDLLAIRGISRRRLEQLRPYVTVGPSALRGRRDAAPRAGRDAEDQGAGER